MPNLKDLLPKIAPAKKGPTSEHAEMIERVVAFMGETNARFGYWCGRCRDFSPSQLHGFMKQASEGKNPRALFQWFIKKKKLSPPEK